MIVQKSATYLEREKKWILRLLSWIGHVNTIGVAHCLVFRTKDLYLVITQKLRMKTVAVFMKSGSFHEKWQFSWKALWFSWKALWFSPEKWKAQWKAPKTAGSTQISHLDLVFHRVQREGQLGISYILVVFGGAHVFGGACMCIWCTHMYL